jgi:cell division protein FtsL
MNIKRVIVWTLPFAILVGALYFFFGKEGLFFSFRQLKEKQEEIEKHHRTIDSLEQEIRKLTSDTAYMERIAREKLGMARKNEKVYKFVQQRNR